MDTKALIVIIILAVALAAVLAFALSFADTKLAVDEDPRIKEVADMLGISQSYISRLEKKIISKMKKEILSKTG